MVPGYNHNVKYKDRVYHVQTEDSGVENPHIITHVFVGGNIIESRKTSYADIAKSENLSTMLVEIMQDQHKGMLKDLINGRYDEKIAQRSVNAATLNGPAPLNVEAGAQHRSSFGMGAAPAPDTVKPITVPTPAVAKPPPLPPTPAPAARPVVPGAATWSSPPPPARAVAAAPPPEAEKVIEAETLQRVFDSKNESVVDSIFGGDIISEKSLDEVILSYLAEDLTKT